MYTGIVQASAFVSSIVKQNGVQRIKLRSDTRIFEDAEQGASVAIDGTCLTLAENGNGDADFDISERTAKITTLKYLRKGTRVNVERSHRPTRENGGHSLYGHIDGVAEIVGWMRQGDTVTGTIEIPSGATPYLFRKGFIGLQGCSLTIDDVDEERHRIVVNLIPETLRLTTLGSMCSGDYLNYEIDQTTRAIVDTIRRTLPTIRTLQTPVI